MEPVVSAVTKMAESGTKSQPVLIQEAGTFLSRAKEIIELKRAT